MTRRRAIPNELTPRERQVLDLIHQGYTNRGIAEALGISLAGAKFHVSEILGKLGVESREEAATCQPQAPAQRWRWSMFPQVFSMAGAREALGALSVPKLAGAVLLPVTLLGAGGGIYAALHSSESRPPTVAVSDEAVQDPCAAFVTYQCLGAELQTFTTLQDAVAVASFQPALPAYIPDGFNPVAIRHTRPEGTTSFVQSEDFKRGCTGCDPRMSHNDQLGVYYRNAAGKQLAVLQGFPATLLMHEQLPDDKKGIAQVGDRRIYWHRALGSADQITLYWDVGRVGTGWAKHPDGNVVYGSPMSYSITSNGLGLEELLEIAASVSFE